MLNKIGFDNKKYIQQQTDAILQRIDQIGGKLYLEFGGKIFDDYHAGKVLPGFDINVKTKILLNLKEKAEILFCIKADDLESNRIRADFGISYGSDLIRLVGALRGLGLLCQNAVITQFENQPAAVSYKAKLENTLGMTVYIHRKTKGYPTDVKTIVSEEGYGQNPYIETTRPLVVVTAPGPNSGKLATCLAQLYHEHKRGVDAGYAKFETFPVWNLPLDHPVNLAYEAATADIGDINMEDSYHKAATGIDAVNYNRDLKVFPILNSILKTIYGREVYRSPTEMGVNRVGFAICDDEVVREAAKQEIIRRYYRALTGIKLGNKKAEAELEKIELLMGRLQIAPQDRPVVQPALDRLKTLEDPNSTVIALQLKDGSIVTGRNNGIMTAAASVVLNAVKKLAGMPDEIKLISEGILKPMVEVKVKELHYKSRLVNLKEVLLALSICAVTSDVAERCLRQLKNLDFTDAHSTCILREADEKALRRLNIFVTSEPTYNEVESKFD